MTARTLIGIEGMISDDNTLKVKAARVQDEVVTDITPKNYNYKNLDLGREKATITISVDSNPVLSRFIGLPPVDKKRIEEVTRYEARLQIPFDLDEVVTSCRVINYRPKEFKEIEVALFAMRKEYADFYANCAREIGIKKPKLVPRVDSLNKVMGEQKGQEIVINIAQRDSDILIREPNNRYWIRSIPLGLFQLEKYSDKDRRETIMNDLSEEVIRSIGYYKTLSRDFIPEKMTILGGTQEYAEALSKLLLNYNVTIGHSLGNAKIPKGLEVAVGAALIGQDKEINYFKEKVEINIPGESPYMRILSKTMKDLGDAAKNPFRTTGRALVSVGSRIERLGY